MTFVIFVYCLIRIENDSFAILSVSYLDNAFTHFPGFFKFCFLRMGSRRFFAESDGSNLPFLGHAGPVGWFSAFFYPSGRHSTRFSRGGPRPRADHHVGQAKECVELMAVLR